MDDLNKVILCLEKFKVQNLGQNPDNIKHYFMKDFDYESEDVKNLTEKDIVANVIKSMLF